MIISNKANGEDFLRLVQRVQVLESVAPTLKDIPVIENEEPYEELIIVTVPIKGKPVDPFELPEAEPLSGKDLNHALNKVTIQRDILQEHNDFLRPQVAILAEQLRIERRLRFADQWIAIGLAVRWRSSEVALAQTLKENFHL